MLLLDDWHVRLLALAVVLGFTPGVFLATWLAAGRRPMLSPEQRLLIACLVTGSMASLVAAFWLR